MSYPITWKATRENGVKVFNSTVSPLSGGYSLEMSSNGTEWDVTDPGLRKSASIFIKEGAFDRGFIDGRIRTLIRRNSANQSLAWGGVYIISDQEGIGTAISPGQNRYEITDKDGDISLIKYVGSLPTVLFTSTSTFLQNTIHGFEVKWVYDSLLDELTILVKLGLSVDFSDLSIILQYIDSSSPLTDTITEGFFVQADQSEDFLSYNFDKTSVFRSIHL